MFVYLSFYLFIFSNPCTEHGAQIQNLEIKSHMFSQLSQSGTANSFFFFL